MDSKPNALCGGKYEMCQIKEKIYVYIYMGGHPTRGGGENLSLKKFLLGGA